MAEGGQSTYSSIFNVTGETDLTKAKEQWREVKNRPNIVYSSLLDDPRMTNLATNRPQC